MRLRLLSTLITYRAASGPSLLSNRHGSYLARISRERRFRILKFLYASNEYFESILLYWSPLENNNI